MYSDTNVMMVPMMILITAVTLLCFRTLIPLVIRAIPPMKNTSSTSKNGHFISIILCMNSIFHPFYLRIFRVPSKFVKWLDKTIIPKNE